jgi:subtilisin family serine protease
VTPVECRRPRFAYALCAVIALLACFAPVASTAGESRQILVTVPQEHVETNSDFRRPPRYAGGARIDALLDALASDYALRRDTGWPIRSLSVYCEVFEARSAVDIEGLLARLRADPRVEGAQPVLRHHTRAATYDDPLFRLQHAFASLRLEAAHALSRGNGVHIAIIDSGIDRDHPDLRGRVARVRDLSRNSAPGPHGTAIAGLIAARANNGIGIVGVAPEARLLDLRACWPEQDGGMRAVCDSFSLARALDTAIEWRAEVINLSLSGPEDPLVGRLIGAAVARGATVVVAVGEGGFPASRADVIAVASEPRNAHELRAPGHGLITTFPGDAFDYVSGDSFAAAQVAGLVALLRARHPRADPAAVRRALLAQQPLDAYALLQAPSQVSP